MTDKTPSNSQETHQHAANQNAASDRQTQKHDAKKQKHRHNHANKQNQDQTGASNHQTNVNTSKAAEPQPAVEPVAPKVAYAENTPSKPKNSKFNTIALLISLIVIGGGVGAFHFHQQSQVTQMQTAIDALQTKLDSAQQNTQQNVLSVIQSEQTKQNQRLDSINQTVTEQLAKNNNALTTLSNQTNNLLAAQDKSIQAIQEKLSAMSSTDSQVWLISQADYLVKLAGRKIWQDNDFTTAQLLLKSADLSLAEAKDPSLLPIRQAIAQDIASLAAVNQIDFDGIVLNLTQLANRVSYLVLQKPNSDVDLVQLAGDTEAANTPVSESVSDWKQNLSRNWNAFLSKFVTIKKRDNFDVCQKSNLDDATQQTCHALKGLLAPEQQTYVRENLRLQLLIAAQSVPRHNNEIYQNALQNVETWVKAYFDQKETNTSSFIKELTQLKAQSISTQYVPERFKSAALLENVMQKRVRSFMSQNTAIGE